MRYFIILILTITVWSCGEKSKSAHVDKFVIKTYSIALDTNVQTTLYFNNHYYCLTAKRQFICLDNEFKVDSSITNSISQQPFDYSYISGDSLIAVVYVKDAISKEYYLNSELKWQPLSKTLKPNPFFEDDKFTVSSCCAGEWGGAVYFTNKKSNRVYSCPATCATIINKIGEIYFLTNTLEHISGSTKILKIEDPTKLYELTADSLKNHCNWWTKFVTWEDYFAGMKKFEIGTQKIFDTIGVLTLTSFVFNNNLYHINSDRNKTFISKIQGDSLLILDSIFNKRLWSYAPEKYGKMQLSSFYNQEISGFLTINGDRISIITFDNRKKKNNYR